MKNELVLVVLLGMMITTQARGIQIYGHRGARGLVPENALPSYRAALAIGVDYVDMDVQMTRDGIVVVYHDYALNVDYTRDAAGKPVAPNLLIKDLTFPELQSYDIGTLNKTSTYGALFPLQQSVPRTRIPSLEEVIDYTRAVAGDAVGFQIELKNDPSDPMLTVDYAKLTRAVLNIMERKNILGRTEVQAFDWRCLVLLEKLNPAVQTAFLTSRESRSDMLSDDVKKAGLWTGGQLLKDYEGSIKAP